TEFADIAEALAEHRVAGLFATDKDPQHGAPVGAAEIFANVQALSGAAANNAVYEALLEHGDTILGMNLTHGGHLTHGSPYNRSGRYFNVVSYGVSSETGRLDYDEIERLALEHKPRLIIAGASAYPWTIDWRRLREIADKVPGKARLMADIAHPAGLVVAGLFPNPIGYAHVVTFTTHKTMLGPRGAAILCTSESLSKRIDRAVFPGEQGGPHLNNIFAMAVAFKLAEREEFRALQRQIVANAVALAEGLQRRGLRLAYGGTNTHLLLIDLNAVKTKSGVPLKGDVLARILELCGVVANKNTIPGDLNAAYSSALRLGTVWVTQRGMDEAQMDRLAGVIADVTNGIQTFAYAGASGPLWRGKLDLPVLRAATDGVRDMVEELKARHETIAPVPPKMETGMRAVEVRGPRAAAFLQEACTADVMGLAVGDSVPSFVADADGEVLAEAVVLRPDAGDHFWLVCQEAESGRLVEWFGALSDGYTIFDRREIQAKVQGPVVVVDRGPAALVAGADTAFGAALAKAEIVPREVVVPDRESLGSAVERDPGAIALEKPYFVGQAQFGGGPGEAKPAFTFAPYEGELRKSCLYAEHLRLTAARNLVPFAGWTMPVWYTSIGEEHRAVRETAGLFDVTHMGVLEVRGEHAARFLDLVTTNYVPSLKPGQAQYAYLLFPDGAVIDDVLIYCLAVDRFMLVVNAANAEKDKIWLDAVNARAVHIDEEYPAKAVDVRVEIRDLKDPATGNEQRVDVSLQGPASLAILRKVMPDVATRHALRRLGRSEFLRTRIAGVDTIVSRTGYTGEHYGYELYLHPDRAPEIWRLLLAEGAEFGLKPAGLGARDSTRTEAGLPLYGHELAGHYDVSPGEAGYGSFVKLHKTFFVGRNAFAQSEAKRKLEVVRFQMNGRGVRMAKTGDPVVDKRGEVIGHVTSAVAIDGQQTGLAYVDRRYAEEGTAIGIFPLPRERGRGAEPGKPDLKPGDRVLIHEEATVVSRFPARQKS
ncbi:MAG: glycine cleavage system aminomethyltransferase GcvT, partial [Chloroflexota bacterium]